MIPAIMLAAGSAEFGLSSDTTEESLLWFEERELMMLAASYCSCPDRLSASAYRRSLFLEREKRDLPLDDCLDLSEDDMLESGHKFECTGASTRERLRELGPSPLAW